MKSHSLISTRNEICKKQETIPNISDTKEFISNQFQLNQIITNKQNQNAQLNDGNRE